MQVNARNFNATDDVDETFIPPVPSFKTPDRLYFLAGKPLQTTPDLVNDEEAAAAMYRELKAALEGDISYLLARREEDPYRDLWRRLAYEASWGGKRQAPTFVP